MALSSIRIFAGTQVWIAMCIRFIKMVVSENPPGGAWGVTVAHRLIHMSLYMFSHITAWTQGRPLLPALRNSGRFLTIPLNIDFVIFCGICVIYSSNITVLWCLLIRQLVYKFIRCMSSNKSVEFGAFYLKVNFWVNFTYFWSYFNMLNDANVASTGFFVRTHHQRIRNSKKIATIRDFHLQCQFFCLSTRLN